MFDSTYNEALSMLRAGYSGDEVAQRAADALNKAIRAYEEEKAQKNSKQPSESETRAALHGFLAGLNDLYMLFSGEGLNEDELEECVDEARGLEPSGLPRLNSLVAPYSGLHYRTDEFCHQCLIPIKGRKG